MMPWILDAWLAAIIAIAGQGHHMPDTLNACERHTAHCVVSVTKKVRFSCSDHAVLHVCVTVGRFQGHSDIISGIGYLHALDCYITSSWDGALRLWKRPQPAAAAAAAGSSSSTGKASAAAAAATSGDAAYLLPEDSEDAANYVSEYEKAHPLVMPKALSQVRAAKCTARQAVICAASRVRR